jgi:hypothetical protein
MPGESVHAHVTHAYVDHSDTQFTPEPRSSHSQVRLPRGAGADGAEGEDTVRSRYHHCDTTSVTSYKWNVKQVRQDTGTLRAGELTNGGSTLRRTSLRLTGGTMVRKGSMVAAAQESRFY